MAETNILLLVDLVEKQSRYYEITAIVKIQVGQKCKEQRTSFPTNAPTAKSELGVGKWLFKKSTIKTVQTTAIGRLCLIWQHPREGDYDE
jgi:hypothetical protein